MRLRHSSGDGGVIGDGLRGRSLPRIRRRTAAVTLGLAWLVGGCTKAAPGVFGAHKPTVVATPEIAALERAMFQRLNRDRQRAGLAPLAYDEALADVARAHSFDMQRHDFFAHESPSTGVLEDRMDRAGYLAKEMRENLAAAPTVDRAEDNLLESPGHRQNIMATSISHLGVGIVRGDAAGDARVLLITQVFARPAVLATASAVEAGIQRRLNQARQSHGLGPITAHPMLAELAADHIEELPDSVPTSAVDDISKDVSLALNRGEDHGLVSIQIVAQAVFDADEFSLPDALDDARTTSVGIAARAAHDERGRPRVKVLVLLGRR